MKIYPPSKIENCRKLEIELSVFQIDDQYASGFSLVLPEEITRDDFLALIDALKSTITSLDKVVDRL